ncbi:hypothetical protein CLAFUW4_06481 [Fulvia fulva]|uniref:Zn(2)-C6 fungal-type domain-containing protein n=1 Tax=Passalora fulva TaxID=5499 RepID=A0A9Q8PAW3_PASFU|nr:uncharacterized protein CLAFUR5_06626 [Fulvia fulva]KAK4622288.1 hypothetical protein CLAFUR4_06485 [Fulvia fulva]KAK4623354.1 hypothetical protein CLAFUR0_06486 [Fulvia fulva]UJO19051.1 hypothetical protein CLAFUR5_06626 [Fulvia fulva]WPV15946.1 hypothetical protein CLAFUW4_06481 [Fulvia fulva]WPV30684.1 hypothetical protein CLAFUW7_06481 [Fulvia fulva]
MSSVSPPRTVPAKRRNGMLQSCEPCRKRKLSCDHRLPACGRCVRRGTSSVCYYHPAPLTKSSASTASAASPSSNGILPISTLQNGHAAPGLKDTTPAIKLRQPKILSVPSAGILMESATKAKNVGFMGESTTTAVIAELNSSLGIHVAEDSIVQKTASITDSNARSGSEVLAFFQDTNLLKKFLDRWFVTGDGFLMFRPVYRFWYDGLVELMQRIKNDKFDALRRMEKHALHIWRNSQQPLRSHANMSAKEWALQATGENLRWETLGMFLALIGSLTSMLPAWDPIFKTDAGGLHEKSRLAKRTLYLQNVCADLSKKCGSRNDLLACVLYERVLMMAFVHGDTANEVWTSFSEACDTAVLMGLHLEIKMDAHTPFFLYELRLRLFNVIYSMDKFLATFLGRPPHISYRYSVVQVPHDLSDEQVCMDPADRQAALDRHVNTWTVTGRPHRATWRKAWSIRHLLREDVLEIVIGPHIMDLQARCDYVRAQEKEAIAAMPEFARTNPEELIDTLKRDPTHKMVGRGVEWTPFDVSCLFAVHCGIRHADFLMERAIVNKTKANPDRLIASSRSLLKLVLKVVSIKDYLSEYVLDMTDSLAFYAVPPAGVLAMEMLRRDQINDPYDDFPRSEVLQQLAVLMPALEAVRPDEGNHALCTMGLNAIRKVLDRLLSRPRVPATVDTSSAFMDSALFGANIGNDADFLQWLGNVDFEAGSWLDPTVNGAGFEVGAESMQTASV